MVHKSPWAPGPPWSRGHSPPPAQPSLPTSTGPGLRGPLAGMSSRARNPEKQSFVCGLGPGCTSTLYSAESMVCTSPGGEDARGLGPSWSRQNLPGPGGHPSSPPLAVPAAPREASGPSDFPWSDGWGVRTQGGEAPNRIPEDSWGWRCWWHGDQLSYLRGQTEVTCRNRVLGTWVSGADSHRRLSVCFQLSDQKRG